MLACIHVFKTSETTFSADIMCELPTALTHGGHNLYGIGCGSVPNPGVKGPCVGLYIIYDKVRALELYEGLWLITGIHYYWIILCRH